MALSGLAFLDLLRPDFDPCTPQALGCRFQADHAEEGQAVRLLCALSSAEDHVGNLNLLASARVLRDRWGKRAVDFTDLSRCVLAKVLIIQKQLGRGNALGKEVAEGRGAAPLLRG